MHRRHVCVLLLMVPALAACGRSPAPDAATRPATQGSLTFNEHIAPILFEHCASCHRPIARGAAGNPPNVRKVSNATNNPNDSNAPNDPNGPNGPNDPNDPNDPLCIAGAPFSVLDYKTVRDRAKQIASATSRRAMPPWLPEAGHGHFINERRLRDDQVTMIRQWAEQGAPEGDPARRPTVPPWADGWQLGTPDLVLTLPQPYTLPAGKTDVFRNFVLPVPLTATRYVRAMEFRSDNPRSLHHANIAVDLARVSRALDRADNEPGFGAMVDDQVQNVFGWSPGKAPFLEPADRSWTLETGSDLVVQLHMVASRQPATVQPSIGLFFSDTPPTQTPIVVRLESKTIDIPAGQADYLVEDAYVLPTDVDVVSVYPHAHFLAKEMRASATLPDGSTTPLLYIKQWDVRWQDQYRYATPVSLPKGTTLSMRFTYDNSDHNRSNPSHPPRRVLWGPQSADEMASLWLEVIPRRAEDARLLTDDYERRALRADIAGAETHVRARPADPAARNALAVKYLQAGNPAAAVVELNQALRLNARDAEAHSNLGTVLQAQGRPEEAMWHLREAARLAPRDDRVRVNLGNAMTAAGDADAASGEFTKAAQLNPNNADAHFNLAMLLGPRNRLDEAEAHLRRVIEINPRHADAHRNLAVALGLQGRIDEAIPHDRTALRIRPDSAETSEHLNRLLAARAARGPQLR